MTYSFEVQANGSIRLKIDGVYKRTFGKAALIQVAEEGIAFEIIDIVGLSHRFYLHTRTIEDNVTSLVDNVFELDGVDITGTVEDMCMALDAVFLNVGSGTTTPGWDIIISNEGVLSTITTNGSPLQVALLSPDNTAWELKRTSTGAIQADTNTTLIGVASIQRTSPDSSVWTITINNEGVLSQTKP